jgi:hypothetical protein
VGLTTILRGTPYHASRRETYLPIELMAKVFQILLNAYISVAAIGTDGEKNLLACLYAPLSLEQHKMPQEELFRGHGGPALTEVVFEVASNAKVHLLLCFKSHL